MVIILLQPIDVLNSILQMLFVGITILVGLIIASKYFKNKDRVFLMVGLAWIGTVEPWMASIANIFYTLITGNVFNVQIYLLIGMSFIPLSLFLWFFAMTDLIYEKKQTIILIVVGIYGVIFEGFFLYYVFTDPATLAELHGVIEIYYKLPLQLYLFSVLILSLITGIDFARISLKSQNPEIRLQGRFLLIAFILFISGSISDTVFLRDMVTLFFTRFVLITASLCFYFGFINPNFIKKRFKF